MAANTTTDSIARSMHDDALDAFRNAYLAALELRATTDICAYCGTAATAVTNSDILVCAGHADMRHDRYIPRPGEADTYTGMTAYETEQLASTLLAALSPVQRPCAYIVAEGRFSWDGNVQCGAEADYAYTLRDIPAHIPNRPTLYCVHHVAMLLERDIPAARAESLAEWLADGTFSTLD